MLIDSHCHLNTLDLSEFNQDFNQVLVAAKEKQVTGFLSVCVELSEYPQLERLAQAHPEIQISVGVHPNSEMSQTLTPQTLCDLAANPACIALGETGLDYYRTTTEQAQEQQRERFRAHIQAAKAIKKPLIIHTRQAAEDTLNVMRDEKADEIGGVMHCFSEDRDVAKRSLDLGFYISFSGILTFKNATQLHDVAKFVPLDRILIETDSPYLAPVPFRGKQNHPALVYYVAQALASLRTISFEEVARSTTENFNRCFRLS
jgi:TatD DNase family protein